MKKQPFLLSVILLILSYSCIEEPFDNTQLNQNYWTVFSESIDQVALDHLSIGSSGVYGNSIRRNLTYRSDILDTVDHKRLYLIHERKDSLITVSYYDSTYFETEDVRNKISWEIENTGLVTGGKRYDTNHQLLSSEKYKFDFYTLAYQNLVSGTSWGRLCRITEKQRFNSTGELIETLKYTYLDYNRYEITHYNSLGEEIRVETIK